MLHNIKNSLHNSQIYINFAYITLKLNIMITLFVLLLITIFGGYIMSKGFNEDKDGMCIGGLIILILGVISTVAHSVLFFAAPYHFNSFLAKRNAFELTLKEARQNGNEYEVAAITKYVADWNQELAQQKYNNTTFVYGQYVDDRIETLEPIK